MSAYHTGMVWLFSGATGSARLVLLALADHAAHDGSVTISQARLADLCKCATETVRRAIADLIEAGEIEVSREAAPTRYMILPPSNRGVITPEIGTHTTATPQNEGVTGGIVDATPTKRGGDADRVGHTDKIATSEIQLKETGFEKNSEDVSGCTTAETQLVPVEIVPVDVPESSPYSLPPVPASLPQTDVGHVLHALGVEADPAMPFYWFRADHADALDAVAVQLGSTPRDLAALIRAKGLSCQQLRRLSDLVEVMK